MSNDKPKQDGGIPELELGEGSLNLAGAKRPRGGMAVPAGGQSKSGRKTPPPYAGSQASGQNPGQVSQIQGMSDLSHNLPSKLGGALHTQSHVASDDYVKRRKVTYLLLFLLIFGGIGAGMYLSPEVRDAVVGGVESLVESTRNVAGKATKKLTARDANNGGNVATVTTAESEADGDAANVKRDCELVVQASVQRLLKERMEVQERVDVARCFMVYDDPASVEAILKPLRGRIIKLNDRRMNTDQAERYTAEAYHLLILSYIKQHKKSEANQVIRNRCRSWARDYACVGKLMVMAGLGYDHSASIGLSRMLVRKGRLDRRGQALFWYAGAQLASKKGETAKADEYYRKSLGEASASMSAILKTVYESYALFLYQTGQTKRLRYVIQTAFKALAGLDRGAKIKLKLLYDLADPRRRQSALQFFLTRGEVSYRAVGDLDLILMLGPESFREGMERDYLKLLKSAQRKITDSFGSRKAPMRALEEWRIRTTLSMKNYEQVLRLIGEYQKSYGQDEVSFHLKGNAYQAMSPNPAFQMRAAKEYQKSLRKRRTWEGLYALGTTLLRAQQPDQVPSIIKDMMRHTSSRGQLYWLELMKAEYYIATRKYRLAMNILERMAAQNPSRIEPRRLMQKLFDESGKPMLAVEISRKIDDIRKRNSTRGVERFASPFGPLALQPRALQ